MNLLSVNQLSKSFGDKVLFKNINFGINYGDKVALIAKNGSGKSTLFKILQGIEIPDSGDIAFRKELRISFLSQEPELNESHTIEQAIYAGDSEMVKTAIDYTHLVESHYANPTDKTENQLDVLTNKMNDLEAWNVETQIMLVCSNLGLNDLTQKVSTLSGGQKKRLALAQVILNEPDLLIMDEPTNHLDVTVIEWLEDYLRSYKKSILLVTHDRYFLDRLVDHVFAFEGNGVVKDFPGNYTDYRQWVYDREDDDDVSAPQIGASDNEEKNKNSVNQVLVSSSDPDSYRVENNQTIQKKKLSFKEQKELETIETDLAQLEKRKAELEALLAGGITDAVEIQKTSLEFNTVSNSIDEKTLRWLELQD